MGGNLNDPFLLGIGFEDSGIHPSSQLTKAINLYFQYCHRQPIWLFDREEVKDPSYISEELACSILTLTSRFSQERDEMLHYGDSARTLVMLRIANGTVDLETIESLCLLAYSSFLGTRNKKPDLKNATNKRRWQHSPRTLSSRPCSPTLSFRNARH